MIEAIWKRTSVRAAALFLFSVAVYLPALHAGFIWDDADHLTQNPCVVGPLGLKEIWTSTRAVYYPLVLTSFWALHKIVGLSPFPYHLINVLMHSGSALLLWLGLRQLGVRAAWLGATLWALHPVTVQSVAWVTELKNTQSCFFYLLSILLFLKADNDREIEPRKFRWLFALSLLSFILAITSKPATVMLPAVLALCLWWRKGTVRAGDLFLLAPFLLVAGAAAGWTVYEQVFLSQAIGADWSVNWMQRFVIAGWNLWFYLSKIVWPHPLIFIYPRWKIETIKFYDLVPLLAAAGGLFVLWRTRNRFLRPVFFAAAYFAISLFPVLGFFNVYFFKYSFVSDHFQYLACIGPLALAGSAIPAAVSSLARPRLSRSAVGAAVLLALALLTWRQTTTYTDVETLYRTTIERNPECWMAQFNLGMILLNRNEFEMGVAYLRKAAMLRPNDPMANTGLADALRRKDEMDEAGAYYQKALEAAPMYVPAHIGLAIVLEEKGEPAEAVVHYQKALETEPNSPDIHYDLASVLFQQGRIDDAVAQIRQTLALQPNNADAYVVLGNAFLAKKFVADAIAQYSKALAIRPDNAAAKSNLAWILASASEPALRNAPRAIELAEELNRFSDGKDLLALRTLAAAYAENKEFNRAVETAQRALQLARAQNDFALCDALQQEIHLYEAGLPYQQQ